MSNETNIHRDSRLAKLKALQDRGYNPYPYRFQPDAFAADLQEKYKNLEAGTDTEDRVTIAGRAMAVRNSGMFIDVKDASGKIQAFCHKNHLSENDMEILKNLDVGDIVGISGYIRRTPRGELSIAAEKFDIISKSLQPLPEKFHGLTDVDARYRQRYVDFIMNDDSREVFKKRCEITSAIRRYLDNLGFLEVETPMLSTLAGGAAARPFITHHNALNATMYLRIATELHLKRCIVGGLEKVYEIGRILRNEGIDTRHNPEFTTLEVYEAWSDYQGMMALAEGIIDTCCREVLGTHQVTFMGRELDLRPPFPRRTMDSMLQEYAHISLAELRQPGRAQEKALYLLEHRDHSKQELTEKIARTAASREAAQAAADRMEELGLIDDRRFAQDYARELFARKGFGPRRVAQELRRKGIAQELVDELLEAYHDPEQNSRNIRRVLEKKYPAWREDEGARRRAFAALQRLGYSYGQIREALDVEEDWD